MNKTNKNQTRTEMILYGHPIIKGIIILSLPIFLNNILKAFHDMVDMFFLARMDASSEQIHSALAAINIQFPVYNFFLAIGTGLAIATVALVSQYLGAKDKLNARKYSSQSLFLAIVLGLIVTLIYGLLSVFGTLPRLMGATGHTLQYSIDYFFIRGFEFIPVFVFLVYQGIRQSEGKTKLPVIINVLGIIINLILTWLFVAKFGWGIKGAAVATLIGQFSAIPLILIDITLSKKNIKIDFKEFKIQKPVLKDMLKVGVPAAFAGLINSLGFIIIQAILLGYGEVVSTGFGAGNKLSRIISNSLMSVSAVLSTYIGNNLGNDNPKRAKKAYYNAVLFTFILSVVFGGIAIIFREQFNILLLGKDVDEEVLKIADLFAFILILTQPLVGVIWCDDAYFNGSGNSKYSFLLGLIRLWVLRLPTIFIIGWIWPTLGYHSIWISMLFSNLIIIFVGAILRKKVKLEKTIETKKTIENEELINA